SLTATFAIASNATPGKYSVTTSTSQGTSNTLAFTVAALPTIASISPPSGFRGATTTVTITGTNFDTTSGTTQVAVGNGITASNVNVASAALITVTLNVDPNAALGNYNVTVTTKSGSSNATAFSVTPQGPSFTYGLPATLDPTLQAPLQLGTT